MRVRLLNDKTGKTKTISRPDGYPAKPGDKIRFKKWKSFDDIWTIVDIRRGKP